MVLRFADCSLDPERHEFRRGGALVHVEPQVFDLLMCLARADGALVTRDALVAEVWRGLHVSDATISARIAAARAAAGDTGKVQRVIQTVPRRGFRLVAPLVSDGAPHPARHAVQNAAVAPEVAGQGARPEIRMVRSHDGLPIAWGRSGSGAPLMRASHWLSHLELDWQSPVWAALLHRLGQRHSLVRYDQRGTGLSGRSLGSGDLADFVADLAAVADVAGLDRFPIFAASQAGPVALRYAAEHPERVSRIVLVGAFAEGRALRGQGDEDADEDTVLALIRRGWGRQGSTFVRAFSTLFMPGATPEQIDDFVRIQLASATPDDAVALRRAVDRFDVTDILDKVRAPVLLFHAVGDVIQPVAQARLLASRLPDARLSLIQSDSHVLLPQDPEWARVMTETEAFLGADSSPDS